MKAFLYARVSTSDQDTAMQIAEMMEFAKRRNWTETVVFQEVISSKKRHRPVLEAMLSQLRRRKCDVLLVYKFDRFARSLRELLNALEEFEALGVQFVSLHDNMDTTTPTGRLMFQIVGAFAEFERAIIRERVKSGMAAAKAAGTHCGRPSLGLDPLQIAALRAQGLTWDAIGKRVGAGESTCRKFMASDAGKSAIDTIKALTDSKEVSKPVENATETLNS